MGSCDHDDLFDERINYLLKIFVVSFGLISCIIFLAFFFFKLYLIRISYF